MVVCNENPALLRDFLLSMTETYGLAIFLALFLRSYFSFLVHRAILPRLLFVVSCGVGCLSILGS